VLELEQEIKNQNAFYTSQEKLKNTDENVDEELLRRFKLANDDLSTLSKLNAELKQRLIQETLQKEEFESQLTLIQN